MTHYLWFREAAVLVPFSEAMDQSLPANARWVIVENGLPFLSKAADYRPIAGMLCLDEPGQPLWQEPIYYSAHALSVAYGREESLRVLVCATREAADRLISRWRPARGRRVLALLPANCA